MNTATVLSWGTFQHLFQRWQSMAAKSKGPADVAADLLAFLRKHVFLASVFGSALSAAFGAYCMYKFVGSDVPALRTEFQKVASEMYALRSDLNTAEVQQRSDLKDHVREEKSSREGITSSLRALRVHSILLPARMEQRQPKPQEVKEVLANVNGISVAEAPKLESIATIGGVIPDEYTPMLAFARKEEDLRESARLFNAATPSVQPAYLGKLLLTKHGTWRAADRQVWFKWDGGSAKFGTRKNLSQGEIDRTVELFNSVSLAASQAALPAVNQSALAPPRNYVPRPRSAPRHAGAAITSQRPPAKQSVDVIQRPAMTPRMSPAPAP